MHEGDPQPLEMLVSLLSPRWYSMRLGALKTGTLRPFHPPLNYSISHRLNSLNGGYLGEYIGDYYRAIKGDMWSLDYSSYGTSASKGAVPIITNLIRWLADFSSLDPKPQGLNSTPKPCPNVFYQTLNPKPKTLLHCQKALLSFGTCVLNLDLYRCTARVSACWFQGFRFRV